MKVILKQDVKGLGKMNEMVECKDGYARNYLLPKKLAVEANTVNINKMKDIKKARQNKKIRDEEYARELAGKINGKTVTFKSKSGENGKLFGSITNNDIADKIKKEYRVIVDKKKIVMTDHIKSTGEYDVEIKLYHEISAGIKVIVKSE